MRYARILEDLVSHISYLVSCILRIVSVNQNRGLLFNEDGTPTARTHKILNATPMGRFGEADELLGTVEWLLDETKSGFVTGVTIPVDGGFSAYSGV